jgi:hypothetical protein
MNKKLLSLLAGFCLAIGMKGQTLYVPNGTSGIGVSQNSNVGIGTDVPSYKLTVDPLGGGGILIGNPSSGSGGYTSLKLAISDISGGYSEIQSIKSSGSAWGALILNRWGGNVGIGCINPANTLDIDGTIHAREVKVNLTGWSDFVFHPTYHLKPLSEVEQYIKTNGHLENIPSAKEVEQNGVNMGDMQKKLLEKIEELTLYSIEQEKQNIKLQQELSEQKALYEALQEKVEALAKLAEK